MGWEKDLKSSIQGEVRFESISKHIYSTDASIYHIEPIGVILPKTTRDIISTINIANEHDISLIPRGAATGISGGCIGKGLIIDTSKYLREVHQIDLENRIAICDPGVVQDDLNDLLAPHGLRLGADTSTGNRATLGGMAANNAAGLFSLRYGTMADHVEEVEVILSDGSIARFGWIDENGWNDKCQQPGIEGNLYRTLETIFRDHSEEIKHSYPNIPRHVSGYNLDQINTPFPRNMARLIVGSEGSLGVISKLIVKLSPVPEKTVMTLLSFKSYEDAFATVSKVLKTNPLAFEMIDEKILQSCRSIEWIKPQSQAVFILLHDNLQDQNHLQSTCSEFHPVSLENESSMKELWRIRKAGLELLLSKRSYSRAVGFLEDIAVAPDQISTFMPKFLALLQSHGKTASFYGHIGAGCMHVRPYMDLRDEKEQSLLTLLMEKTAGLLLESHGALSGEHGDGLVRSWLNETMFGSDLYQSFREIKHAVDPKGLMNPGKVVSNQGPTENLKPFAEASINTFLDFSKEGGLSLSVDLCNGNGLCRKKSGVMCPSYQATRDEYDTTRARAGALKHALLDSDPLQALSDPEILQILDLCIECKGCKTECPSNVDMAKMKSEVLYQYYRKNTRSWRDTLFAYLPQINHYTHSLQRFFSLDNEPALLSIMKKSLGIARKRTLPVLARMRFSNTHSSSQKNKKKVVLFIDTFTEFYEPQIGHAAKNLIERLGYEVIIPKWGCCGRTLFSKGMLDKAKIKAQKLVRLLHPYAQKGLPIIGLEPSCLLMIRDDYQGLLGYDHAALDETAKQCLTLDEWLANQDLTKLFHDHPKRFYVHGHCHQKALVGMTPTLKTLSQIPGASIHEIQSGCCGMAGSFGYEQEHYDLSMKIGGLSLFPTIQKAQQEDIIIASGFSCRTQVKDGTGRKALHLAEALSKYLQ